MRLFAPDVILVAPEGHAYDFAAADMAAYGDLGVHELLVMVSEREIRRSVRGAIHFPACYQ